MEKRTSYYIVSPTPHAAVFSKQQCDADGAGWLTLLFYSLYSMRTIFLYTGNLYYYYYFTIWTNIWRHARYSTLQFGKEIKVRHRQMCLFGCVCMCVITTTSSTISTQKRIGKEGRHCLVRVNVQNRNTHTEAEKKSTLLD